MIICTGNRNRSPLAEAVLKRETESLPVSVSSLGLLDLGPVAPLPETLQVAQEIGFDLSHHRARSLGVVDLTKADLVLGMEWQHVAAAVVEGGTPAERAFTLVQCLELLSGIGHVPGDDPIELAKARIRLANEKRQSLEHWRMGESVDDPLGKSIDAYRDMANRVQTLISELSRRLFRI